MPVAATNWTAGQLQGLIPTNWTVTDGNVTGIACDAAPGSLDAFYECRDRLGHDRGQCNTGGGVINGTAVCTCFAFGGWDYSCNEARCTYGTVSGCATRVPAHYFLNAVCLSVTVTLVTFTLLYALSIVWKGRAVCSRNVISTTLTWLVLAALSLWAWYVATFISTIVLASRELLVRAWVVVVLQPFQRPIGDCDSRCQDTTNSIVGVCTVVAYLRVRMYCPSSNCRGTTNEE